MIDLKALAAEFPREVVHWRAQSLTRNGDSAMALAYIDARDVYERLDEVCGVEGWQCRYSHAEGKGGKTVCEIGIKINDEWVWKANGAGDSDIEGEKGALSDALKRAAVCWGIGRYLYDMPCPWVPCKTYERNGKKVWKAWDADPWSFVKGRPAAQPAKQAAKPEPANQTPKPANEPDIEQKLIGKLNEAKPLILKCGSTIELSELQQDRGIEWIRKHQPEFYDRNFRPLFESKFAEFNGTSQAAE